MDKIELQQLRYMVAIADAGSFTAAAKKLYVSQQALSHGIKCLEEIAGRSLFERGRLGVKLTAEGQTVYEQARRVLAEANLLSQTFSAWHSGFGGSVAVGIHSLCFQRNGGTLNGDILLRFKDQNPDVDYSFSEIDNNSMQDKILDGTLDLGIGIAPLEGTEGRLLYEFPVAAVFSAEIGPEYFVGKTCTALDNLSGGTLVTFSDDHGFNRIFLEAAARDGVAIRTSPLRTSVSNTIEDVLAGEGLYILKPLQHALRTIHTSKVRVLPVVDRTGNPITVPLLVFWKSGRALTRAERDFVDYIERWYRDLERGGSAKGARWSWMLGPGGWDAEGNRVPMGDKSCHRGAIGLESAPWVPQPAW